MTPVAIGDIQRTQGTLKTVYKAKKPFETLVLCLQFKLMDLCGRDRKQDTSGVLNIHNYHTSLYAVSRNENTMRTKKKENQNIK